MGRDAERIAAVEITADVDRPGAEALQLEVRRLLRRHGLEVGAILIEKLAADDADPA